MARLALGSRVAEGLFDYRCLDYRLFVIVLFPSFPSLFGKRAGVSIRAGVGCGGLLTPLF